MSTQDGISAIVLAGGEGRRAGGRDKGLIDYRGKPLVAHVLERIAPQVDEVLISANRHLDQYRRYSEQVIPDETGEYRGPLAGIAACLPHCSQPLALVVACDMPQLPTDLVSRLTAGLTAGLQDADIAIAQSGGHHQLALLLKTRLLGSIQQQLDDGQRKLIAWAEAQKLHKVSFDDCADAFINLNRLPVDKTTI